MTPHSRPERVVFKTAFLTPPLLCVSEGAVGWARLLRAAQIRLRSSGHLWRESCKFQKFFQETTISWLLTKGEM